MRAVNLIPEELRPRIPGEGDPRIAYGVLGGLAILLVFVLLSISYSNKLHTIQDETAAVQAQINQHQSVVASAVVTPDTIGEEVKSRTLLVGGLAKTRFPWGAALNNLSKSLPPDTTLNSITATSGAGAGSTAGNSTMVLEGCTSGWQGYSRFMAWLKTMPGVESTKSNSSAISPSGPSEARAKNCGPTPLTFNLTVKYGLVTVDLTGLPKPPAGASGATGAAPAAGAPAAGAPAAATTPAAPAGGS